RHAVRAENRAPPGRYFSELLHENGAEIAQLVDHVFVGDDLFTHINRRPIKVESNLYDIDRAHNPRAKAAGFQEINLLFFATIRGDWFERHSDFIELRTGL